MSHGRRNLPFPTVNSFSWIRNHLYKWTRNPYVSWILLEDQSIPKNSQVVVQHPFPPGSRNSGAISTDDTLPPTPLRIVRLHYHCCILLFDRHYPGSWNYCLLVLVALNPTFPPCWPLNECVAGWSCSLSLAYAGA